MFESYAVGHLPCEACFLRWQGMKGRLSSGGHLCYVVSLRTRSFPPLIGNGAPGIFEENVSSSSRALVLYDVKKLSGFIY